jgi:asparagine synthase (glutamine-hydrolysing)
MAGKYDRLLQLAPAPLRRAALGVMERAAHESPDLEDRARRIKRMLRYSLTPLSCRPVSWTTGFDIGMQQELWREDAVREAPIHDIFEPLMRRYRAAGGFDDAARRMITDILVYLPDNNLLKDDVTGMANSLEVRVPLLDHRVAELAAALPTHLKVRNGELKYILKKVAARFLPRDIINRPKQGFTVPVGHWMNHDLAGFADDALLAADSPLWEFLKKDAAAHLLNQHRAGRADHSMRLWALIVLSVWLREAHAAQQG